MSTSIPPGTDRLTARLAAAGDGHTGVLHVRLDSPAGPLVGVLPVRSTGGFDTLQEQSVKLLRTVTGTHDVHLVAAGASKVATVDWLSSVSERAEGAGFLREPRPLPLRQGAETARAPPDGAHDGVTPVS
ncbi:carbohydrate-binding protein [Streptomyces sp. NPDC056831]|uniref:carbohydrate-binding protein n=1 Tax=Streptomyces sp. NPDC056831 TaxID=3345954 RepID=UPI0036C1DE3B